MKDSVRRVRFFALALGVVLGGLPAYASTSNYVNYRAVAGDFNGDGWTDVILQPLPGAQGTAELIAYPDGNFGAPLATWPNESGGTNWNADAHRLVVGDFNGDGRDDVLLQGAAGLQSRIAFARADGNVSQTDVTLPDTLGGLDPSQASHHLVVGDFNGDGRDDLLLQANSFVGTDGVALAGSDGSFTDLASKWSDGFHGFSWSQDRESIVAGDFAASGSDELLMRSTSATGTDACCELIGFDKAMKPTRVVQQWAADFLGVNWQPSTHLAIVGDFNGDAHADVLLQPRAPGGEVDLILTGSDGLISTVADRWSSERDGVDWSAQSYLLVPENAAPGQGATLLMVPKQTGLPYRRAQFDTQGQLQSVVTVNPPASGIFAPAGGSTAPSAAGGGGLQLNALVADAPQPQGTPGTMNGQASVSNGVAGYSIKIAVPPGRAGMQPSLTLGYSSNGGDGHEGVGWSLGGFSAIYRCPATIATDGYTSGTTFSYSDRFCLDGKKLMLTSGGYGQDGSVYHTEVNGFSTITAHGTTGNGPSYFTVQTPIGDTLTYGQSGSADLLSPNGSIFSWSLTKSVDPNQNEIEYDYEKSGGENWPSEIVYTLGNGSARTSARKVVFSWESRSQVGATDIVHYLAGMRQTTTKLLTGIETEVGSSMVRNYTLNYALSPATQRPLLTWVQTCASTSSGQTCFSPTDFTYQGQQAMTFAPVTGTALGLIDPGYQSVGPGATGYGRWLTYDVDGDGRTDLIEPWQSGIQRSNPVSVSQPEGSFQAQPDTPTFMSAGSLTFGALQNPIDYNLDGCSDMVVATPAATSGPTPVKVAYVDNCGSGQAPQYSETSTLLQYQGYTGFDEPLVGDFNGDGWSDLAVPSHPSTDVYEIKIYTSDGNLPDPTYTLSKTLNYGRLDYASVLDYDADGRSDLLIHVANDPDYKILHSVYSASGLSFSVITTNVPYEGTTQTHPVLPVTVADVNGDSLPDILQQQPAGSGSGLDLYVYINEGGTDGQFASFDTGISNANGGAR